MTDQGNESKSPSPGASQVEEQARDQTGQRKVQVRMDERELKTSYANGFRTQVSADEVIVDFGLNMINTLHQASADEAQPVQCTFQVSNRVILNYYSAKRLTLALGQLIRRHEDRFGELELNVGNRRKE